MGLDGVQVSLLRTGTTLGAILATGLAIALHPTIQAASIGIPDTLFLMLLALVVFGPRRLPEIGRQIGKLMYEFRKVSNDFKFQMEEELRASEEQARVEKLRAAQAVLPTPPASTQVLLDVPPQPVSETSPAAEPVAGEVRAAAPEHPQILPPSMGEPIAASRPFRGRPAEPLPAEETTTESGSAANYAAHLPVAVADEGRTGSEVQPGVVAGAEREAHHA